MGKVIRADFESKERLDDKLPKPARPSDGPVIFTRPRSTGGRSLVDVAVDAILEMQTIEFNGQSDQPGTMDPSKRRDRALSELDETGQAQAWEEAILIVNETLGVPVQ